MNTPRKSPEGQRSRKLLPYEIIDDSDDKVVGSTPSLRDAHRQATLHSATTGNDTSIWQGHWRILTYFGWRPAPRNRRETDE